MLLRGALLVQLREVHITEEMDVQWAAFLGLQVAVGRLLFQIDSRHIWERRNIQTLSVYM